MFTCFAVNITTLATIGIDRYDAICRAPIRKMTSRTTAHCIVFIWAFACFTAVAGGTGHILTVAHGKHVCARPEQVFNKIANTGKFVMLAVVTLWIVPSLGIIFNRFYGIASYVREYSSHLRSVLGTSGVRKEVKLTKICLVMIITYLSLWVTFAIMVILRNRFSSVSVHCAYLWAYSLAYCSFAVVPIEYMVLDRRLLIGVYQNCVRRPKSKVKPKESSYQFGRDGKATHTTSSQPNERPIQSTMHESPNRATKNINSSIAFQWVTVNFSLFMPLLHAISEESPNVTPNSERLSDTTSWIDHRPLVAQLLSIRLWRGRSWDRFRSDQHSWS